MRRIGIAVIGSGYWGVNYVRAFSETPGVGPIVVCEQRTERLAEIGDRFPHVELATNIADALKFDDVQAAVICTPATTHFEVARQCLEAGVHVLVEKPITMRSED